MRIRRFLLIAGAALLLAGAVWALLGISGSLREQRDQEQTYGRLQDLTLGNTVTDLGPERSGGEGAWENTHDLGLLQWENPDCAAWVSIPGTSLDYPVMHTPEDPEFYLKRGFGKQKSDHGVPFLDARCSLDSSGHLIVYGHHMSDGSMFSALHQYKEYSFYKDHPIISWETAEGVSTYRIAAVLQAPGEIPRGEWSIFNCLDMGEPEFEEMASHLQEDALYYTGVTPVYGDRLLTLATCEYSQENGRLAVVAVKD